MEVDERLRWLEGKTSSSLHPKGEDLRGLLSDENNRCNFLEFCNNSESRHLFVYMSSADGCGPITVSKQPPPKLSSKLLFLLKCTSSSRLIKESISQDVVYSECSELPLEHLELLVREVYLPVLSTSTGHHTNLSNERIVDLLHRLMGTVQVTEGQECGELVLVVPSLEVLSEWMMSTSQEKRAMVVHIMETCVVSWMKQVKIALHFEPGKSIVKSNGKMAGPLAEVEYWDHRLYQLMSVRGQLGSMEVLQILHRLDHAHSTYTDAFTNIHRDIAKAINDTELVLMYLTTLKPWFLKLHAAFSPDTLIKLFPPLLVTLSLVWQHSGFYGISTHFHRLLRLLSNELSLKARDIIGHGILNDPGTACTGIRLALRVCSAFRGHYLDRKESCEETRNKCKEKQQKYQRQGLLDSEDSQISKSVLDNGTTFSSMFNHLSQLSVQHPLCPWPARNATAFRTLNMTMERCNDLLELVQTMEHFSELSAVASLSSSDGVDPILTDIYNQFNTTLDTFRTSTHDLLSLESNDFEQSFFTFRSSVKSLESRLSSTLLLCLEECSSLDASLRLLESYQGLISRDAIRVVLQSSLDSTLDTLHSDMLRFRSTLSSLVTHPPIIPNTPPTSTRLIWLKAVRHRVTTPLERMREAAPYLLEGDKGFTLRHVHSELVKEIESHWSAVVGDWTSTVPLDIESRLHHSVLRMGSDGVLMVNYDGDLEEVLREIRYLNGPLLSLDTTVPQHLRLLSNSLSSQSIHQYRSVLEVCVRLYNELHLSLDHTHRALFTHKLQQLETLVGEGITNITWTDTSLPDYLARLKGSLTSDLMPSVEVVLDQTSCIVDSTHSWTRLSSLDVFDQSNADNLNDIQNRHSVLVKVLQRQLKASLMNINTHVDKAFKVVDVSSDSPPWTNYLSHLDNTILSGLKDTLLKSLSTLSTRAQKYEQGGTIPPLVGVSLVLRGKDVLFDPPLSSVYSIKSVPETIRSLLEEILLVTQGLTSLPPTNRSYYHDIIHDPDVQSVLHKITAHVDTSARQCQSLCKRFTQYGFLWEQDVITTFNSFLMGVAEPHPRKFTRPETVNRSRSATHSANRSRSQSAKLANSSTIQSTSIVMEVVTGYSDWEFLRPDVDNEVSVATLAGDQTTKKHRTTSLEDFDNELAVFQGILERLAKSPDSVEVGWIRVDQLPVKDTLTTFANKWIFVYTNYLEKKVLGVLYELEEFFMDIGPEVEGISSDEVDPAHIMKLVTILNKVNLKQVTMDGKFGAVHRAVALLEKFNHPIPSLAKAQFEAVPQRWSSLKKRLSLSKQRLMPHVQSHSGAITKDLKEFDDNLNSLHNSYLASECLSSGCGPDQAPPILQDYTNKLSVFQAQYKDLMELQELLQSAVVNFSLLKLFEEELKTAVQIWRERDLFFLLRADWKGLQWMYIDTEELKESCDSQLTTLDSMGAYSNNWDIKTTLIEEINEILHTVPLVEGLCSPYMRPRHWKLVLKYSPNLTMLNVLLRNGAVDTSALSQLTFGKFMDLKLTSHSDDVLTIIDKASKDIAVEELLKNLEEVWLSMTFQFKSHTRIHGGDQAMGDISSADARVSSSATPVSRPSSVKRKSISSGRVSVISATPSSREHHPLLLLENVSIIMESLDHYQSSLQHLHGSITASSFKDELHQWHKRLQIVEAVLGVWSKVQALWVQLEEVLSSREVEQCLPTQHYLFTTTDKEWRTVMKETAKSANVLKVCLQEDLLSVLDKFHQTLLQCQSTLLHYMEGRRVRCQWFYFLQLEDILSLVCYSSRLQILSECIPKLIPYCSSVLLIDSLPGSVPTPTTHHHHYPHNPHSIPYITGIVNSDGQVLLINEFVRCEGPVESIINHLMHSIETTLNKQLETSLSVPLSPPGGGPVEGLIQSLISLWDSATTHQVILLSTQLMLHQYIDKHLELNHSLDKRLESIEGLLNDIKYLELALHKMVEGINTNTPMDTLLSLMPSLARSLGSNSTLPSTTGAVKTSESQLTTGSGIDTTMSDIQQQPVGVEMEDNSNLVTSSRPKSQLRRSLLCGIINIVLGYKTRLKELTSSCDNDLTSWEPVLHYTYQDDDNGCLLRVGGANIPYGSHYTGSVPPLSHLEGVVQHILLTMKTGCSGLICNDKSSGSCFDLVKDLSRVFGYPVFPVICSGNTSYKDLMNMFKGIAATGCWIYLHNIHLLPVPLIGAVVNALQSIKTAKQSDNQTVNINGDTFTLAKTEATFCIASTTLLLLPSLPHSIHNVFLTYTQLTNSSVDLKIESFLVSTGYKSVAFLTNILSTLLKREAIDFCLLECIIHRAMDHLHTLSTNNYSTAYYSQYIMSSYIAQQVLATGLLDHTLRQAMLLPSSRQQSAKQPTKLEDITEEGESEGEEEEGVACIDQSVLLSQREELTCVLVAVWELMTPQSKEGVVSSLEVCLPGLGAGLVLDKALEVCQELSNRYPWTRELVESLQESRATSVMYNEASDVKSTSFIEETVLQCCLMNGLNPSGEFLHSTLSLLLLLTRQRVTMVTGSSISGRRDVIKTCIEALKMIGHTVTVSNVPVDAIGEEHLLGQQQGDSPLLSYVQPPGGPHPGDSTLTLCPLHLVVLEGHPSSTLLDTLHWLSVSGSSLTCSNMKSAVLNNTVKFIVMTPPTSPPPLSTPLIAIPSDCTSWYSLVQKDLLELHKSVHYTLLDLFSTHLPNVMELFSGLYQSHDKGCVVEGEESSDMPSSVLHPQLTTPNQLQLVKSMCKILKCLLGTHVCVPADDVMERVFTYSLIWSFGGALNEDNKRVFQQYLTHTFTTLPDITSSTLWEYTLYGNHYTYHHCKADSERRQFVYTSRTAAIAQLLQLLASNGVSVIIDGPCGSGKTSFALNAIPNGECGPSVLHLLMTQEYTTGDVWTQLRERLTWHSGTTYIPQGGGALVALVEDIHLTQVNDSRCDGSIIDLIQHHVSTGTVCVPGKEQSVNDTMYICTTDSNAHPLNHDMLTDLVYIHWDLYSSNELVLIYSELLSSHFLPIDTTPNEINTELLSLLVNSTVQIHTKISSAFIPTKVRTHYYCTLSTLDSVLRTLTLQCTATCSALQLLTVWLHEMYWAYAGKMTSAVDRDVYTDCVSTTIRKYFCDHQLLPRLLSQISARVSHDTLRSVQLLLTQTQQHLDLTTPWPLPLLHDSALELASRITHHLSLPHTLSSLVILGVTETEALVSLISSANGYTFLRPSQATCSDLLNSGNDSDGCITLGGVQTFKTTLKNIYSTSALKNERILVFIDDHELIDPSHLPPLYQYIKDCSISVEYTMEEKVKLTNGLRAEVCSDGSEFSHTLAWKFFIDRVRSNVRVLMCTSNLTVANNRGVLGFKDLLNSTTVLYQLPWNRKYLVNIAETLLKDSSLPSPLLASTAHLLSTLHITLCDTIHQLHLTLPTNELYQHFVQRFCHELGVWVRELSDHSDRLSTAISCVDSAKGRVGQLHNQLTRETVVMEEKIKSYSQLTVQMGQDMAIAEEQNKLVVKQTQRIQHLQQVLPEYEHIYEQYNEELSRIEHSVKDIALNLDQQSLLDLRSHTKPSQSVQELLEAVIMIVKSPSADISWTKGAKRLMANVDRFREMMMEFTQNQQMSEVLLNALQSYTAKSSFTEDHMTRDSGGCIAVGQLCAWVLGVESYHKLLEDSIRPIDTRRIHVKASLREYTDRLTQLQHKVKVLDDRLEGLGSAIQQASIDKSQQEIVVYGMKRELKDTEKFVNALSTVSEGWSLQSVATSTALSHHIGPLSLSVTYITYLTRYPPHIVQDLVMNTLRPCVNDIGFSVDKDPVLNGLLDELCPTVQPQHVVGESLQKADPVSVSQEQGSVSQEQGSVSQEQGSVHEEQGSVSQEQGSVSQEQGSVSPEQGSVSQEQISIHQEQGSIQPDHSSISINSVKADPGNIHTNEYDSLCRRMLYTCRPNRLLLADRHVVPGHADIVCESWNRWSLVSDPEHCLELEEGEWTMLNGKEWTFSLVRKLEQAVVEGQRVLLSDVHLPLHPVLLPIIEVGLYWDSIHNRSPSIEFCGRRLHMNRLFRLIMTTPTPPEAIPTYNSIHLVNLTPNLSLTQSQLLLQSSECVYDTVKYTETTRAVSDGLLKVNQLNTRLLQHLDKMGKGEAITVTVDRIEQTMSDVNKVVMGLRDSYKSLDQYTSSQLALQPVCLFGSLAYLLIHQLERKITWFSMSLNKFQAIFVKMLQEDEVMEKWKGEEEVGGRRLAFEAAFRRCLIRALSAELQTVLSYPDHLTIVTALMLLDKALLSPSTVSYQMDQLLYILGGDQYIPPIEEGDEEGVSLLDQLPPRPHYIPQELFAKLYSVPVDPVALEAVRLSMIEGEEQWAELLHPHEEQVPKVLPWQEANTLDDLVVFRTFSAPLLKSRIVNDAVRFNQTLAPRSSLMDILSNIKGPLLVLYDTTELMSQANSMIFDEMMRSPTGSLASSVCLDGNTVSVNGLIEGMTQCSKDIIIVRNLHSVLNTMDSCTKFGNFMETFHQSGKQVFLLLDSSSPSPPLLCQAPLMALCQQVHLSAVLPPGLTTTDIASSITHQLHMAGTTHLRYLYSLLVTLSVIPRQLPNNQSLMGGTVLAFLGSALHCQIYCRSEGSKLTSLQSLCNCLSTLYQSNDTPIERSVGVLKDFFKHQYLVEDDIVDDFLRVDLFDRSSMLVVMDDFPLPVPDVSLPLERCVDHVIGIVKGLTEGTALLDTVSECACDSQVFQLYHLLCEKFEWLSFGHSSSHSS